MPKRLYLLRHGETDANVLRIIQGQGADLPLNDTGLKQAECAGEALAKANFHHIYMSPALRAGQTAQKVLECHVSPVSTEIQPGFSEINFGVLEGKTVEAADKSHPELLEIYREKPSQCVFPLGESIAGAYKRIGLAVNSVLMNHPWNESILIVSHGGAMSLIFDYLFDLKIDTMFHVIRHNNCGLSIVEWKNDDYFLRDKPKVICLNDISHLKNEHLRRLRNSLL